MHGLFQHSPRRAFAKGELVNRSKSVGVAPERDNHSLQIGENQHVYVDEPACLFSHSCDWNLYIKDNDLDGFDFYAYRDIAEGEELTFYYGMSEAQSVAVPECRCNADSCWGKSYGFTEAPPELQKALYQAGVSNYLKNWYLQQNGNGHH